MTDYVNIGVNGVQPGFKYYFKVRGKFQDGIGEFSPAQEIDVFSDTSSGTGDTAPATPGSFAVVPTIDSFVLSWIAPITKSNGAPLTDMKDYVIEVRSNASGGSGSAAVVYTIPEAQSPPITNRDRTFEFSYKMNIDAFAPSAADAAPYFHIYARDTTNNRSVAATDHQTNTSPSAPTATFSGTSVSGGVALSWGASASLDTIGYVVKTSTSAGFDPTVTGTEVFRGNALSTTHYTATLANYYRVGAYDTFGQTTWLVTQVGPIDPGGSATPPGQPGAITAGWNATGFALSWSAGTGTTIDYEVDVTINSVVKKFTTANINFFISYEDIVLLWGAGITFTVTALSVYGRNTGGLSTVRNDGSVPYANAAPTEQVTVSAIAAAEGGAINVSWTAPVSTSDFLKYNLYVAGSTLIYSGTERAFTYATSDYINSQSFTIKLVDGLGQIGTASAAAVSKATDPWRVQNTLPLQYSSFEFSDTYYEGLFDTTAIVPTIALTPVVSGPPAAMNGVKVLKAVTSSTTNLLALSPDTPTYNVQVEASTKYWFSAYIWQNSGGARAVTMRMHQTSSPTTVDVAITGIASGSWSRIYGSYTTNATDTTAYFSFVNYDGTAPQTFYIDAVQVEKSFDGQTAPLTWNPPRVNTVIDGAQIVTGSIQSVDWNGSDTGWQIDTEGIITANEAVIRGTITAEAGTIGAWIIAGTQLKSKDGDTIVMDAREDDPNITVGGLRLSGVQVGPTPPTLPVKNQLWIDTSAEGTWGEKVYANEKGAGAMAWSAASTGINSYYLLGQFIFGQIGHNLSLNGRVVQYYEDPDSAAAGKLDLSGSVEFELYAKQETVTPSVGPPVVGMIYRNFSRTNPPMRVFATTNFSAVTGESVVSLYATNIQTGYRAGLTLTFFEHEEKNYSWVTESPPVATLPTNDSVVITSEGSMQYNSTSKTLDYQVGPVDRASLVPLAMMQSVFKPFSNAVTLGKAGNVAACFLGWWSDDPSDFNTFATGGFTFGDLNNTTDPTSQYAGTVALPYSGIYRVAVEGNFQPIDIADPDKPQTEAANGPIQMIMAIEDGIVFTYPPIYDAGIDQYRVVGTDVLGNIITNAVCVARSTQIVGNITMVSGESFFGASAGNRVRLWVVNGAKSHKAIINGASNFPLKINLWYLGSNDTSYAVQ